MAGAALPDTYGQRMIHIATHRIRNVPPSAFETPVPAYTPEQRPARITHEPVVVPIDIPVDRIVHNDLQNVHDHSVVHATRHILENIEKNDQNDRNSRPEIESALLDSALNDDDKIRALAVLDSLTTKTHHSSFKMTETDAFDATKDIERLASGVSMLKIATEPTMFGRFIKECAFTMMFDMQAGDGVHIAKFLMTNEIDIVDVSNEPVPRRGAVFKSAAVASYCFIENFTGHKQAIAACM